MPYHFDFTFVTFKKFIASLDSLHFSPFVEYLEQEREESIILRHDVDALPSHSLRFAQIQKSFGIRGSYYFRIIPESLNAEIIEKIANLGHEIGYHYEDLTLVAVTRQKAKEKKQKVKRKWKDEDAELDNLLEQGIESFAKNLAAMRQYADIQTICMHGSPMSKWDSRLLWTKYDYRDFGIVGEPYFDIDFTKVAYYTDTGRRWDGDRVSVRDKVNHGGQDFPKFRSTFDIIRTAESGTLPSRVMFTFHPQRWHDRPLSWLAEWASQNTKNAVKRWFFVPGQKHFFETSRSHAKQNIK